VVEETILEGPNGKRHIKGRPWPFRLGFGCKSKNIISENNILWGTDRLLGNDREVRSYTTAVNK
jgi:hypothetical protein